MKKIINLNREKKQRLVFTKPGDYLVFFKNLSGEYIFELKEKEIHLDIYGLYIGRLSDSFQLKTKQHHLAPKTTSNLFIKGVFRDRSKFCYQGLIRIEKTGQGAHAYQKNQNLVLSEEVFVDSKPELEILANDVFCTHGATTGRLNPDELYYLETRGLEKKKAEKLLIDGFINQLLCLIPTK